MNTFLVWLRWLVLDKSNNDAWFDWYGDYYLQSNHWYRVRNKRRKWAKYKCEKCGTHADKVHLDTHHRKDRNAYKWLFMEIWWWHLQVLCRSCHRKEHA